MSKFKFVGPALLVMTAALACASQATSTAPPARPSQPTVEATATPPEPTTSPSAGETAPVRIVSPTPPETGQGTAQPAATPSALATTPVAPTPRTNGVPPGQSARATPTPRPVYPAISVPTEGQGSGGVSGLRPPDGCQETGAVLTASPMDLDRLGYIIPMGRMQSSHVTPTDHTYFRHDRMAELQQQADAAAAGSPKVPWETDAAVYTPAGGLLTEIEAFPNFDPPRGYSGEVGDYRVIIWHSCSVLSIYIHLSELSEEILDITGELRPRDRWSHRSGTGPIPLSAGQAIGKIGPWGFDYSLHDTEVVLPGFVVPEHYAGEAWKIHTVDPFAYFTEPVRSALAEKSLRDAEPRAGRIDYDADGRLIGNWFLDGTKDYSGNVDPGACVGDGCNYWSGHLAIAYDHIDPGQVRVSIGRDFGLDQSQCTVCQGVYAVNTGSPDPAEVSVNTGLVKYQLLARQYADQTFRERTYALDDQPLGVLLTQLEDDRTLRMEVIPGAPVSQVTGFTDAAVLYRR